MALDLRRRGRAQAPFLVVLGIVAAAFVFLSIAPGHWRRGTALIALAMILAAVLRFTVPAPHIGMLAVRGRRWDSLCYLALGALILTVDIRLRN